MGFFSFGDCYFWVNYVLIITIKTVKVEFYGVIPELAMIGV